MSNPIKSWIPTVITSLKAQTGIHILHDWNPYSLRIWIPRILQLKHSAIFVQSHKKENLDSRILQLKDSGNPDFYGIGRRGIVLSDKMTFATYASDSTYRLMS